MTNAQTPKNDWFAASPYRTPIKTPRTGEGWIPGVPTKSEVEDDQFCIVSFTDGELAMMDGDIARDSEDAIAAWMEPPPPYVPTKEPKPGEFWRRRVGGCTIHVIGKRENGGYMIEKDEFTALTVNRGWFDDASHLPGVRSFDEAEDA